MNKDQMQGMDNLLSRFRSQQLEIACVITSLFHNTKSAQNTLFDVMNGNPYEYVMNHTTPSINQNMRYNILGCFITEWDLQHLVQSLALVYTKHQTLYDAFVLKLGKAKYAHEALIALLGNNAGFQTKKGNGTFFRLNFMLYLLFHRTHLWAMNDSIYNKCLLPCDDDVIDYMSRYNYITSTDAILPNVVKITNKAKEMDNIDFYNVYNICKGWEATT